MPELPPFEILPGQGPPPYLFVHRLISTLPLELAGVTVLVEESSPIHKVPSASRMDRTILFGERPATRGDKPSLAIEAPCNAQLEDSRIIHFDSNECITIFNVSAHAHFAVLLARRRNFDLGRLPEESNTLEPEHVVLWADAMRASEVLEDWVPRVSRPQSHTYRALIQDAATNRFAILVPFLSVKRFRMPQEPHVERR